MVLQKFENNIFAIFSVKSSRGDYHMETAAHTKTFLGFDVKTEDTIDAAVIVTHS